MATKTEIRKLKRFMAQVSKNCPRTLPYGWRTKKVGLSKLCLNALRGHAKLRAHLDRKYGV